MENALAVVATTSGMVTGIAGLEEVHWTELAKDVIAITSLRPSDGLIAVRSNGEVRGMHVDRHNSCAVHVEASCLAANLHLPKDLQSLSCAVITHVRTENASVQHDIYLLAVYDNGLVESVRIGNYVA